MYSVWEINVIMIVHNKLLNTGNYGYSLSCSIWWITWSKMRLTLNCSKSSVMWFSMKPICTDALPAISVNNTVLKVVNQKYLGVVFDNKLQWSPHIDKVCKSMSYYLYMIGSHRTSLAKSISKMLVESLVLSQMRYTISKWGPALQQRHILCLQWIQNRGVWLSCDLKKYDHVSSHFLGLGWLSVQDQIKQSTLSYMYRQCHYQSCLKLNPPIQFGGRHSYSTRTNRHFANIARFSTAFGQKSFCYKGMTWWNALPSDFIIFLTYCICAGKVSWLLWNQRLLVYNMLKNNVYACMAWDLAPVP